MNAPLDVLGWPYTSFFALVVIGGVAGLAVGRAASARHWFATLFLVGVAGSWIGSEVSVILGLAARGTGGYFVAATAGAGVILWSWQQLHPE